MDASITLILIMLIVSVIAMFGKDIIFKDKPSSVYSNQCLKNPEYNFTEFFLTAAVGIKE